MTNSLFLVATFPFLSVVRTERKREKEKQLYHCFIIQQTSPLVGGNQGFELILEHGIMCIHLGAPLSNPSICSFRCIFSRFSVSLLRWNGLLLSSHLYFSMKFSQSVFGSWCYYVKALFILLEGEKGFLPKINTRDKNGMTDNGKGRCQAQVSNNIVHWRYYKNIVTTGIQLQLQMTFLPIFYRVLIWSGSYILFIFKLRKCMLI